VLLPARIFPTSAVICYDGNGRCAARAVSSEISVIPAMTPDYSCSKPDRCPIWV
jgi:hypothetical protein